MISLSSLVFFLVLVVDCLELCQKEQLWKWHRHPSFIVLFWEPDLELRTERTDLSEDFASGRQAEWEELMFR